MKSAPRPEQWTQGPAVYFDQAKQNLSYCDAQKQYLEANWGPTDATGQEAANRMSKSDSSLLPAKPAYDITSPSFAQGKCLCAVFAKIGREIQAEVNAMSKKKTVRKPTTAARKKAATKKVAKKAVSKKTATRKAGAAKKSTAKKATKAKAVTKATKKTAKKAASKTAKKTAKKVAKKAAVKKTAKKTAAKTVAKKVAKKAAKKSTTKKTTKKSVKKKTLAKGVAKKAASRRSKKPARARGGASGAPSGAPMPDDYSPRVDIPEGYMPSEKDEYMCAEHLEYFRRKLLAWREDLVRESQETITHLRQEVRDVGDEAERATRETENSLELRTRDRYRKLISKIDDGLSRIDDGRYGYCDETDEEIGIARLEARPIATLTLDAQERWEHRQRTGGR